MKINMKKLMLICAFFLVGFSNSVAPVPLRGGTDNTTIGNTTDRLNVHAIVAGDINNLMDLSAADNITFNGDAVTTASIKGYKTLLFTVTGTWSATLEIEGTADDTTWVSVKGAGIPTGKTQSEITTNGVYAVNSGGLHAMRLRATTYTSGTATIAWNAATGMQTASNPIRGGRDGTIIGNIEDKLRVQSKPYLYDIAKGVVPGHSLFRAIGYGPTITTTRSDLCDVAGTYVFPPAGGIQMRVISSNANDTAAGTGARTVDINYLDASYNEQTELVTLNGTTAVSTVATNILRVNGFHSATVGSNGVAVGNVSLQNTGGTISYAKIAANGNVSRCAVYTVPAGKKAYITEWSGGVAAKAGEVTLRTTSDLLSNLHPGVFQFKLSSIIESGGLTGTFTIPVVVPATGDIKMSAVTDAGTTYASGGFAGWIEND